MRAVRHRGVSADNGDDFLPDGVHLSQQGNAKFRSELWLAIEAFRSSDSDLPGPVILINQYLMNISKSVILLGHDTCIGLPVGDYENVVNIQVATWA